MAACSLRYVPSGAVRAIWEGEKWPAGIFYLRGTFPQALDLLPRGTPVAHCVSSDFVLGGAGAPRGFAADVADWAGRPVLLPLPGGAARRPRGPVDSVIELVSKARRADKPSLASLRSALLAAAPLVSSAGGVVCIPALGCGRDGLQWEEVSALVGECWPDFSVVVLSDLPGPRAPVAIRTTTTIGRDDPGAREWAIEAIRAVTRLHPGPWWSSDPRLPLAPTAVLLEADEPDWFDILRQAVSTTGLWLVAHAALIGLDERPAFPAPVEDWAGPRLTCGLSQAFPDDVEGAVRDLARALQTAPPHLRRPRVVIDVASVRIPMTALRAGVGNWRPMWVTSVVLWVRWQELVAPGIPPVPPPLGATVSVSKSAFLSQRSCDSGCLVCDRHDAIYRSVFGHGDASPDCQMGRAMRFAQRLAGDPIWFAHPGGGPSPGHKESVPAPGEEEDTEALASCLLQAVALAPRPPRLRAPPPEGYQTDARGCVRLPWFDSVRRPLHETISPLPDGEKRSLVLASLVEAVASGDAVCVPHSFPRLTNLWFLVEQEGGLRP